MKKIVLTGGGTAGHVYPALALCEKLKDYEVHFIGGSGMEKEIVKKQGLPFHEIRAVKLERKLTMKNLLIPFKLLRAISDAQKILKQLMPNVIFSKGGFVSVPTVIAAYRLKIPVVSHESDLSIGLANKIILHFCKVMCCSFKDTAKGNSKLVFTGQPIRKVVFNGDKNKILQMTNFDKNKKNLLIIGGSLGAKFINDNVTTNIDQLLERYNVVHITGKQSVTKLNKKNYLQISYADNIGDYYAFADVILSRAGSGAINEFVALKKPALLVPLSKKCSRGDQIENAKLFASQNLCEYILEEDFNIRKMLEKLNNLTKNEQKYRKNMQNMQNFNACDKIIDIIKSVEN